MFIVEYRNILYAEDETARMLTERFTADRILLRTLGDKPAYYLNLPTGLVGPYQADYQLGQALLSNQVFQVRGEKGPVLLGSKQRQTAETWIGKLYSFRPDLAMNLPVLSALVKPPAYSIVGGRLELSAPGFNPRTGWYVTGAAQAGTCDPAYPHLRALLSGLTFATNLDRGNVLGWLAAAYARTAIREFPILILDGTHKSVGKTTLSQTLSIVLTGQETATVTYTHSEEELEKRIGDKAELPGPNLLIFDNVRAGRKQAASIHSQLLSSAATTGVATGRVLFKGMRPVHFMIPVFTMNSAQVEHDLHDKVLRILLTRPVGAVGELHFSPFPLDYAREHRDEICAELRAILAGVDFTFTAPFVTRMHRFETIAGQAAAALGETFDLRTVLAADGLYNELIAAHEACGGPAVALRDMVDAAATHPDTFPEINSLFLQRRAVAVQQRVEVLQALMLHYSAMHPGQGFSIDGKLCCVVLS